MLKTALFFIIFSMIFFTLPVQSFAQNDDKLVVLHTNLGNIVIEFFPDDAPNHVSNFIKLAEEGFYDGILFHRIIPGFMIQGGDPNTINGNEETWGLGGPEHSLDAEFNNIKHKRGIVSMARSTHVDSAGSQFFIVHKDKPNQPNIDDWTNLDELYTVFGRIVTQESFDTLDKIAAVETKSKDIPVNPEQVRITKAEVVDRSQISDLLELDEPERIIHVLEPVEYTEYSNEKLGFAFLHPVNWFLQEQQNPNEPTISLTGQKLGLIPPIINVIIEENQKPFEDKISEYDEFLQEGVDSYQVEIMSKEMIDLNGRQAYATDRIQELRTQTITFDGRIKQIIFQDDYKYYTLTYYNDKKYFDQQYPIFEKFVTSFEPILIQTESTASEQTENPPSNEGGGCLIATATFGSEMAPQVQQLRELRDNTIMSTKSGAAFMTGFNQFYYSISPSIADIERQNPLFKEVVKITITPMLVSLSLLNYANIDTEQEMLGYGMGIIMMNIGMYFIAPIMIVYKLRK